MSNPECIQPDKSERFTVTSLPIPVASIQTYNDIKKTELAIAAIYNGSDGGSVHDEIYVPPIPDADGWHMGRLFFVIDTYDPRLGINAERPDDKLQAGTEQTSISQQQTVDEKVQDK